MTSTRDDVSNAIDDIKADVVYTMTPAWHRLFLAGGCDPQCHSCEKNLPVGVPFKLGTLTDWPPERELDDDLNPITVTKEVMLCDRCDQKRFNRRMAALGREHEKRRVKKVQSGGSGCFRINGRIVP